MTTLFFNILQNQGPSCLPWVKSSAGKHYTRKHLCLLTFYKGVKTIRWHPVQTLWKTLTLSNNAINNHNDNIDFQNYEESRSFLPPMSKIQCWQTIYEVLKTIRWHPVQTLWITLTLSNNAINNHNDHFDFQYFAESRSFLPPMSQIQCWQALH
jgi:hypothetical protein